MGLSGCFNRRETSVLKDVGTGGWSWVKVRCRVNVQEITFENCQIQFSHSRGIFSNMNSELQYLYKFRKHSTETRSKQSRQT